ncbi:MAG: PHP domain-containing protein, partial [Spirochaetales bacterium]|nr:PHP domain-containing protein [Spirochaetales bacterium]
MMGSFVHLHNHSDFSLLDGAASISRYVEKAKALGMTSLALTDHGNMFGAVSFYEACNKNGINPIVGCEFYVAPRDRRDKTSHDGEENYYHLILLAMSDKGYHNLMELNSIAWKEGYYYKPRIDRESLSAHSEDLICLSACIAG